MTKIKKQKLHLKLVCAALSVLFVGAASLALFMNGHAHALPPQPFTKSFLRLDNLTAQTWTGGRVCFQPASSASATTTVQVLFPTASGTDYSVGAGTWNLDTSNLDTGQTALPNLPATATLSTKTITVTLTSSATLSTSNLYCFNFSGSSGDQTLETSGPNAGPSGPNPETTQGTITTNSAGGIINQTTYSESIITNSQVVVSAIVPPSFSFALNGNTDSFTTNLSTSSIVSTAAGRTIEIITNAPSGWIIWAKDLDGSGHQGALQSVTAANYKISGSIAAPAASRVFTTGTEDYGLGVVLNTDASGGGTVSINADYDGTSNKAGTLDPSQFQPIASSNGTANGDIINLFERATIAGQTPAASDYTDTITYTGAGMF